jgi:hypothetical protein
MTHTTKEMKMSKKQTTTTANQTACGSKLNNSMNLKNYSDLELLAKFVGVKEAEK